MLGFKIVKSHRRGFAPTVVALSVPSLLWGLSLVPVLVSCGGETGGVAPGQIGAGGAGGVGGSAAAGGAGGMNNMRPGGGGGSGGLGGDDLMPGGATGTAGTGGAGGTGGEMLQPLLLNDFELGLEDVLQMPVNPVRTNRADVTSGPLSGDAANGTGSLRIEPQTQTQISHVRFLLPRDVELCRYESLTFALKVKAGAEPVALRWSAVDDESRVIYQQRFDQSRSGEWVTFDLPLPNFRWGNAFVGDWCDVRSLALSIESALEVIWLDDLSLQPGPSKRGRLSASPDEQWYRQLGFDADAHLWLSQGGVALGVGAAVPQSALESALPVLSAASTWIDRVFSGSVDPVAEGAPVVLFNFRDAAQADQFRQRLSEVWRVQLGGMSGSGITFQDIALATYSADLGLGRPVNLHEVVHALVARRLRVVLGLPDNKWFHEGVATYVQLAIYPDSLPARTFDQAFARPLGQDFLPLAAFFEADITFARYAQASSLIGYLLEQDVALLRQIVKGLIDRKTPAAILDDAGRSVAELQDAWQSWGRQKYSPNRSLDAYVHFPKPQEWRDL